jgi:hypothetical protein
MDEYQKGAASAIALNINNSSATSPRGVSFTFSAASPNDGTAQLFNTLTFTGKYSWHCCYLICLKHVTNVHMENATLSLLYENRNSDVFHMAIVA